MSSVFGTATNRNLKHCLFRLGLAITLFAFSALTYQFVAWF